MQASLDYIRLQVRGSLFVAAGDVKQSVSVLATEGASKVETIAETVKEDVQSGAAKVAAKVRAPDKQQP